MLDDSPSTKVDNALAKLGQALEKRDIAAAVELFDDDCYWRDLVSFTWNLKTMEGPDAIGSMLSSTLADVQPSGWAIEGQATESGGVSEGWFTFETAVSRGKGHIRLKGDRCWTLLTTMVELKGHEEQRGPTRPRGAGPWRVPGPQELARAQAAAGS